MTRKKKIETKSETKDLPPEQKTETPDNKPPIETTDPGELVENLSTHDVNPAAIAAFEQAEAQKAAQTQAEAQVSHLKKRGRPRKDPNAPRAPRAPRDPKPQTGNSFIGGTPGSGNGLPVVDSRPAAESLVALEEMLCIGLISDEWKMGDHERAANVHAITRYFDSKGGVQVSPLAEVAMLQVGYIAQRMTKTKTQTKVALAKAWLSDKWRAFKDRNKPKQWKDKEQDGTRADSGGNDVRENFTSDPFKPSIPGEGN